MMTREEFLKSVEGLPAPGTTAFTVIARMESGGPAFYRNYYLTRRGAENKAERLREKHGCITEIIEPG